MRSLFIGAASAIAFAGSAHAGNITVLTFEGETAGTIIDDEFAPLVTITTNSNGDNDAAVIFDTNNPTGNDGDLGAAFSPASGMGDDLSPDNILIISEDARGIMCGMDTCSTPDDEGEGGTITFDFSEEVTFQGFDVFDVSDGGATFSVDFFDIDDMLITSIAAPSGIGDNEFMSFVGLGIQGVIRAVFNFGGSGGIDNIAFETSEIPLPAALPLMLVGLGGLGFVSRRRKS